MAAAVVAAAAAAAAADVAAEDKGTEGEDLRGCDCSRRSSCTGKC